MLEVCRVVEVGDVNARSSGWVWPLNSNQLQQLDPPELLLGGWAENTREIIVLCCREEYIFVWSLQGVPAIIQGGKDVGFKVPVGPWHWTK